MTRLAFGGKCNAFSAPGTACVVDLPDAPRRCAGNSEAKAMAPRPVELRVRNVRRVSMRSASL